MYQTLETCLLCFCTFAVGDDVTLSVQTLSMRTGLPVPAVVGLSVVDDSAMQLMDRRRMHPRLPSMALLESEVKSYF